MRLSVRNSPQSDRIESRARHGGRVDTTHTRCAHGDARRYDRVGVWNGSDVYGAREKTRARDTNSSCSRKFAPAAKIIQPLRLYCGYCMEVAEFGSTEVIRV